MMAIIDFCKINEGLIQMELYKIIKTMMMLLIRIVINDEESQQFIFIYQKF